MRRGVQGCREHDQLSGYGKELATPLGQELATAFGQELAAPLTRQHQHV